MAILSKLEPNMFRSILRGNCSVNGQNVRIQYSGKLHQFNAFHKSPSTQYPRIKAIPLPKNLEDIFASEEARFSPLRSRDINGSRLAGDCAVVSSDDHVGSYDCSGSICLSAHMQTNVPSPCLVGGMYTHFNMPRGLLGQGIKYVAGDHVNNVRLYCSKPNEEVKDKTGYAALTRREKLKTAVKEYGKVVIVFHVGISLISLGVCYLAVTSGIDIRALLGSWAPTDGGMAATAAAPFVVAYAVHKAFAPVRISVTLVSVPFIVNYLRRIGLMKPPKSPPKL